LKIPISVLMCIIYCRKLTENYISSDNTREIIR